MDIFFGSGTISNGEYTSRGVQQILEKPVAPLWVEDVFLPIISKSSSHYQMDRINNAHYQCRNRCTGKKKPGSETIAELKCTSADIEVNDPITDANGKSYNKFAAVFTHEGKGFLIDKEFAVIVRGFRPTRCRYGTIWCRNTLL